ncbi:low molecular weight protein-tyrosine-phosphatase [Halomonas sp. GXIMD04776]|uniref:low molecular weight protein-tyrosine-phosphatase n=1 Tax=Halomonas sp. GXIMD04776 TaxID=3415605 RepID=UPI003CA1E015
MFQSILVVCTANICRSPVAEALLKARLPRLRIESAGIAVGKFVGHGAAPLAQELAEADGLDLSAHHAKQINRDMIEAADLILVMSEGQRQKISELSPAATGKTMLFGRWLSGGGAHGYAIPDPYRKSREAFTHVHQLLISAADTWRSKLGD